MADAAPSSSQKWVLGVYISVGFVALVLGLCAIEAFKGLQTEAIEVLSLNHARTIAIACRLYALDHGGIYPPDLDALFPKYLKDRGVLVSPYQRHDPVGYIYTVGVTTDSPPDTILLEDKFKPRNGHDRVIVEVDSSARILPVP